MSADSSDMNNEEKNDESEAFHRLGGICSPKTCLG